MSDLLSLDFETYYSTADKYSLRYMTVEEYIRDPRFEVIMMSTFDPNAHEGAGRSTVEHVPKDLTYWIKSIDWGNTIVISWNAMFDVSILTWHYGVRPRGVICAMAVWRMLGLGIFGGESLDAATRKGIEWGWPGVTPKGNEVVLADGLRWIDFTFDGIKEYARYCMEDARNAYWLFDGMLRYRNFPVSELPPASEMIQCFTDPVLRLNSEVLYEVWQGQIKRQDEALERVGVSDRSELRSDARFAELLTLAGIYPTPTKLNAKGETRFAFAKTDAPMQDILEGDNAIAALLVEARLAVKSSITESRSKRLYDISTRGPWPVGLKPAAAHTLRVGGTDKVNPQNLSKRDGTRDGVEAPDGYVLLDPDSSQIEARYAGYICEQHDLVEDFRRKVDVYCKFGNTSGVFPYEVTKATVGARFLCKTTVLGGGFGSSYMTMQMAARNQAFNLSLGSEIMQAIEEADWQGLNSAYRTQNYAIKQTWYKLNDMLDQLLLMGPGDGELTWGPLIRMGWDDIAPGLILPNGLRIYYHGLHRDEDTGELFYNKVKGRRTMRSRIYGAKVLENLDQAVAGLTIREQWVEIKRRAKVDFGLSRCPIALQVHDALTAVVKEAIWEDFGKMMVEVMRTPPVWASTIPLDAELKVGKVYGKLEEVNFD